MTNPYGPPPLGQEVVASAVKPPRSRLTCPPACNEMHTYEPPCLLASTTNPYGPMRDHDDGGDPAPEGPRVPLFMRVGSDGEFHEVGSMSSPHEVPELLRAIADEWPRIMEGL